VDVVTPTMRAAPLCGCPQAPQAASLLTPAATRHRPRRGGCLMMSLSQRASSRSRKLHQSCQWCSSSRTTCLSSCCQAQAAPPAVTTFPAACPMSCLAHLFLWERQVSPTESLPDLSDSTSSSSGHVITAMLLNLLIPSLLAGFTAAFVLVIHHCEASTLGHSNQLLAIVGCWC